jgi:hypothetical protein
LAFSGFRRRRVARKLTAVFVSNIVKLTYSGGFLSLLDTANTTVKIVRFAIPVAGEFTASFYWETQRIAVFEFNIKFLEGLVAGQSSLICYGSAYEYRWCRATNICWRDRWFTFFGVPESKFNRSIMIPGSRPIPWDYPSCRKSIRFYTTSLMFPFANATEVVSELSYMTCRWYSMQYLWHSLFDYTLPLFWTEKLNGGVNRSARIFTIDENTSQKGYQFISAFTTKPVKNIRVNESENNNTCWRDVVLGFPKSEYEIYPAKWNTSLQLPYEYPLDAYTGFREHMISFFAGPGIVERQCEPDPKNPRVVIFFRNDETRDIENKEDLLQAAKEWCPHCRIDPFFYANQSYGEQMVAICNTSILISVHGSQLSHMVWMKVDDPEKPTAIIEILPYMYVCRNWYEQIALGARIRYFMWLNTHRNNTRSGRKVIRNYEKCLRGEMPCLGECHDLLRDQPTIVNLTEFKGVFDDALRHVSKRV